MSAIRFLIALGAILILTSSLVNAQTTETYRVRGTVDIVAGPTEPDPIGDPDEIMEMWGDCLINWYPPTYNPDSTMTVDIEIIDLNLRGESSLFGPANIRPSADSPPSTGQTSSTTEGETFPAESFFDAYYEVEFPSIGQTVIPSGASRIVCDDPILDFPPIARGYSSSDYHPIMDRDVPDVIVGWARPRFHDVTPILPNPRFYQVDFYGTTSPLIEDTDWGDFAVTLEPGEDTTHYYLQLQIKDTAGGPPVWVIRNVGLPSQAELTHPVTISHFFDLGAIGVSTGTQLPRFEYEITLTEDAIGAPPDTTGADVADVEDQVYNAHEQGEGENTPPDDPGPPPEPSDEVPSEPSTRTSEFRDDVPDIEEDVNECGPVAAARSLRWLHNDDDLNLGDLTDAEVIQHLKDASNWNDADGIPLYRNFLEAKLWLDSAFNLGLVNKFMVRRPSSVDTGHFDAHGGTAINRGNDPTFEFIKSEIDDDEDVEILVGWLDSLGNRQFGHYLTVIGYDEDSANGLQSIWLQDDKNQGEEDPENHRRSSRYTDPTASDPPRLDDLPNNQVEMVISESPIEEGNNLGQLDTELDGVLTVNSDWGMATLTYIGQPAMMYYNLSFNGDWVVQNIPVLSREGDGVWQNMSYCFNLGIASGDDITSASCGYSLTPDAVSGPPTETGIEPISDIQITVSGGVQGMDISVLPPSHPLEGGQAADPVKHSHGDNFPNQDCDLNECCPAAVSNSLKFLNDEHNMGLNDDDLSIFFMKMATNWDPDGCWIDHDDTRPEGQRNAWWEDKKEFMEDNKIPVTTRKITNLADLIAEIDAGQDIELQGEWHTAAIVGITDLGNGKFSIDVAHDTEQGEDGGTITQTIIYNPDTGKFEGSPGFFDGSAFEYAVVECPKEEATPGTNRHNQDGYVPSDGDPTGTIWHELYPNYCHYTTIADWVDNGSGELDYCDYVMFVGIDNIIDTVWEHVEEVTSTLTGGLNGNHEDLWYFDYWYGNPNMNLIHPEIGDLWHQVWPTYSRMFEVIDWADNGNGFLDSCDWIYLMDIDLSFDMEFHCVGIATDVISVPADPPIQECDCLPGDANGNLVLNILDITYLINYLYKGGPAPMPYAICSGDANCDCTVNILDATYLIAYLYKGGNPPCTCEQWLDICGEPLRK